MLGASAPSQKERGIEDMGLENIKVWSKADIIENGPNRDMVGSTMPAWYYDKHLDELESDIRELESALGMMRPENVPAARNRLKILTAKRDNIVASKPKLTGAQTDELAKHVDDNGTLTTAIRESNFDYDTMMKSSAKAAEELRRATTPCVKVAPELAQMIGARAVKCGDGTVKVSRDDATRIWAMGRKRLEMDTDSSILRPTR